MSILRGAPKAKAAIPKFKGIAADNEGVISSIRRQISRYTEPTPEMIAEQALERLRMPVSKESIGAFSKEIKALLNL
jgi:hypothetical protein